MADWSTAGFVLGLVGLILGTLGMVFGILGFVIALNVRKSALATRRHLIALRTAVERPSLGAGDRDEQAWPTLETRRLLDGTQELPTEQTRRLRDLRDGGQPILAIKECRELTGLGLKDARDFVDRL